MTKLFDLTGERFTRLTVIGHSHTKNTKSYWLCVCDCGNEKIARSDSLKRGELKSCNCLNNEAKVTTHNLTDTKLYRVWASMKQRCGNKKDKNYHHYGGRGISVCEEWLSFEPFHEWCIHNGYKEGLSIDRLDVNGNYEPSNCEWITLKKQQNNKRTSVFVSYNGESMTIRDLVDKLDVSYNLFYGRLRKYNYDVEKAIKSL